MNKTYDPSKVTISIGGEQVYPARRIVVGTFLRRVEGRPYATPGCIIVWRDRALHLGRDCLLRGTFVREHNDGTAIEVTRDGERHFLWPQDVRRVEASQHGWTGAPASSGAW